MDIILLQPGREEFFDPSDRAADRTAIGGTDLSDLLEGTGQTIQLVSLHQGMDQPVTGEIANADRTGGRPAIRLLTCIKYVDSRSTRFYEYCLRAEPLDDSNGPPTRVYIIRKTGDQLARIALLSLRGALVSAVEFQSHPNDMPTEEIKLTFTDIAWTVEAGGLEEEGPAIGEAGSGQREARDMAIDDQDA